MRYRGTPLRSILFGTLLFAAAATEAQDRREAVGMRQAEFKDGDRTLALTMFYPATREADARDVVFPFYDKLTVVADAPAAEGPQASHPLTLAEQGRRDARPRRRLSRSGDFDRVYRDGSSRGNRFLVLYSFARGDDEEQQERA